MRRGEESRQEKKRGVRVYRVHVEVEMGEIGRDIQAQVMPVYQQFSNSVMTV
jgi:hypothetical protein